MNMKTTSEVSLNSESLTISYKPVLRFVQKVLQIV